MLMNIQSLGYDFIQGPMGVWNFACFGATAGVLFISIRDKNKDMRQTSLGALAAGLLGGVSEPSLYGIHLRYKLIYKRMLVGCFAGGVVIAVLGWLFPSVTAAGESVRGVTTNAFAFTSLLTIGVQPDVGVRRLHRRVVHRLDGADHHARLPYSRAEGRDERRQRV